MRPLINWNLPDKQFDSLVLILGLIFVAFVFGLVVGVWLAG